METINELQAGLREVISDKKRVWLLVRLSEEYWKISDYSQSKLYAEAALELGSSISDEEAVVYSYHLLGTIYSYLDAYDIALEYHFRAQKSHAKMGLKTREAEAYNSIADIYLKLGNQDKAIECFHKSYALYPEYERTINNLGYIEMLKESFDEAINYYQKAGEIAEKCGNYRSQIISLVNISDVLCKQNKPDAAITILEQAMQIFDTHKIDTPNEIKMAIMLNLGSAFCYVDNNDKALEYLQNAYDLAQEKRLKVYLCKAMYLLSNYYKSQSDYAQAYNFLHQYNELNSSILNSQVIEKASRVQSFYEKETRDLITMNMTERSSRLATMGILSTGITHEINQPLSAIRISAESILFWIKKESVILPLNFDVEINHIVEGTKRIEDLIRQIRRFWNSGKTDLKQDNDLNAVIEKSISPLKRRIYSHGIDLQTDFAASIPSFEASEIHLQQIFINLLSYNIDILGTTNQKQKQLCIRTIKDGKSVKVFFLNNGPALSSERIENLKSPFQQDGLQQETELGMAIIRYYTDFYKIGFVIESVDGLHGFRLDFNMEENS